MKKRIENKFLIIKNTDNTLLINKQDSKDIYLFKGTTKDIIDNIDRSKKEVIKFLTNKYNVDKNKLIQDYDNFLVELFDLSKSEVESLVCSNVELKQLIGNSRLNNVVVEITNNCPFKCSHCYIDSTIKTYMSLNMFKKIVNQALDLNCYNITITGGEPLMNPNFLDMYKYAKENGMIVGINTNAFLLNDSIIEVFKMYKPSVIEISVYGYDNTSYMNFTKSKNAFEIIDKNIDRLLSAGIEVNLKTTLTKHNYTYLQDLKNYAKKKGTQFRYDYLVFPKLVNNNFKKNEECLDPKQIIEIFKSDNEDVAFFKRAVLETIKNKDDDFYISEIFQCSLGKNQVFINCTGDIKPCLVVNQSYNISNTDIITALDYFENNTCLLKFNSNSKCRNCYKRKLCRYCPGRFYLETGSYEKAPNHYCELSDLLLSEFKPKYSFTFFIPEDRIDNKNIDLIFKILKENEQKINTQEITDEMKNEWVNMILNTPDYYIIVCKINDEVVAFLSYCIVDIGLMLSEIQIKEEFQGKLNIFKKIMNEFISKVNINEYNKIYATINSKHTKSKEVFTHIGFINKSGILYEANTKDILEWLEKKH